MPGISEADSKENSQEPSPIGSQLPRLARAMNQFYHYSGFERPARRTVRYIQNPEEVANLYLRTIPQRSQNPASWGIVRRSLERDIEKLRRDRDISERRNQGANRTFPEAQMESQRAENQILPGFGYILSNPNDFRDIFELLLQYGLGQIPEEAIASTLYQYHTTEPEDPYYWNSSFSRHPYFSSSQYQSSRHMQQPASDFQRPLIIRPNTHFNAASRYYQRTSSTQPTPPSRSVNQAAPNTNASVQSVEASLSNSFAAFARQARTDRYPSYYSR